MNPRVRSSLIVGAVVLVFGVAAADALRDAIPDREPKRPATTTPDTATPGRLAPVERTRGSLVFTDPRDCRIREIGVGSGTEFPLRRVKTSCRLWIPRHGVRIAYGVADAAGQAAAFRFLDLNHPDERFRTEYTWDGRIAWADDGQRASWCEGASEGIDFELYAERRIVDDCPRGYLETGQLVFTHGRGVLGGLRSAAKTIVRASGPVGDVAIGTDGSVGVVAGRRVERYARGRVTHSRTLPDVPIAGPPNFSPDNCAALFYGAGEVRLVDLGCLGHGDVAWRAKDADWSPDGTWVAVAVTDGILFRHVVGEEREVVWPQNAAELGWRTHVQPTG